MPRKVLIAETQKFLRSIGIENRQKARFLSELISPVAASELPQLEALKPPLTFPDQKPKQGHLESWHESLRVVFDALENWNMALSLEALRNETEAFDVDASAPRLSLAELLTEPNDGIVQVDGKLPPSAREAEIESDFEVDAFLKEIDGEEEEEEDPDLE
jgi:hypothetical protein